ISPQVWAWRRRRVHKIARLVDRMLVFFPFEVDFYRDHGVRVVHVGHPLVDEVPRLEQVWSRGPVEGGPYHVALLPGSRPSEVEALLPGMLETVRRMSGELPLYVRLVRAPTISQALLERHLEAHHLPLEIVSARRFEVIADSHLALCASGTATLETGLLGTPMIVLYRLAGWTYVLARLLVRLPHFSLVNLVLGRGSVPELVQRGTHPEAVAARAAALLRDPEAIATMRRGLAQLRERLGAGGASGRAADEVVAAMEETEG
ncbi:MAG: lipid-A-disaccharide synthase, partial [Acidobacteria bacterium]|nr:lipid-A-disaccharide synthase [Acidobacteriota bacterium]